MLFTNDPSLTEDYQYSYIRDDAELAPVKAFIEGMWQEAAPFLDREFPREFRTRFRDRYWELYLAAAFLHRGYQLVPREACSKARPDLCLVIHGEQVWVEAVVPSGGDGLDAVREKRSAGTVPEDRIVLRYRSVLEAKHKRYQEYLLKGVISPDERYVVAVSASNIPMELPPMTGEVPHPIQAVFPLGNPCVVMERDTGKVVEVGFEDRPRIPKRSGEEISTCTFLEEEYRGISALLFSYVSAWRATSFSPLALQCVLNPIATSPLPSGWLKPCKEWWWENDVLHDKDVLESN